MKKVDLHIHTISTCKDRNFVFDMEVLKDYVRTQRLDVIAITNHNVFDRAQYERIVAELPNTVVCPGIEIDIDGGHALFIADKDEQKLDAFETICVRIQPLIKNQEDTILYDRVLEIFGDFNDYLIIPHYDKDPKLPEVTIEKFGINIVAGEVSSIKKFVANLKNPSSLVPVLFSDFRVEKVSDEALYPNRQTYIDINEVNVKSLKLCLSDKSKVGLAPTDGHEMFLLSPIGLRLSTGLNILLGKRSSGKTYTLNQIQRCFGEKALYIKQFSLLNTKDPNSIEQFEKTDKIEQEKRATAYLKSFRNVVENVCQLPTFDYDQTILDEYLNSLLKFANEQHLNDAYSKTQLFNTQQFPMPNSKELEGLINAVEILLKTKRYQELIGNVLDIDALKELFCKLVEENRHLAMESKLLSAVNSTIETIKTNLQMKSSATRIPTIDVYGMLVNAIKREKFTEVALNLQKNRTIDKRTVGHFTITTETRPYRNASDMKQGTQVSLVNAFESYGKPFDFLQKLKDTGIESSSYYKYFVKVEYKILNSVGTVVSGGERTEFNFLSRVKDAMTYDILIIDEPESSFDNIFLKEEVNSLIKEMSQTMPVVVSTHNSTIGGSIKPDYIIYTDKKIENNSIVYRVYEGTPDSKYLETSEGQQIENYAITMNSLEAGEVAYIKRKQGYELLKN